MQTLAPQTTVVPIPDPTLLTTSQLKTAIATVKELLTAQISAVNELLSERIKGNAAIGDSQHRETKELLAKGETYRVEAKLDSEKGIREALSYRKELFQQERACSEAAAKKSEESFTKQLESLSKESTLNKDALSDRISTLEKYSSRGEGRTEEHQGQRNMNQWMVGLIIAVVIALIGDALTLVHIFVKN